MDTLDTVLQKLPVELGITTGDTGEHGVLGKKRSFEEVDVIWIRLIPCFRSCLWNWE